MKNIVKNNLRQIPALLIAVIIMTSGISKLMGVQPLVERFTQMDMLPYMKLLGIMEFLFAVLFLFPRTMKIGFLLLTAYFGGAMATELSHGNSMVAPMVILTLVWVAAYVRNPTIFQSETSRYVDVQSSVFNKAA